MIDANSSTQSILILIPELGYQPPVPSEEQFTTTMVTRAPLTSAHAVDKVTTTNSVYLSPSSLPSSNKILNTFMTTNTVAVANTDSIRSTMSTETTRSTKNLHSEGKILDW